MRALVVTGVLGAGCAIVFAIAALVAMLFPDGTMMNPGWNGGGGNWNGGGGKGGMAVPMPAPAVDGSGVVTITNDQVAPQP